MPKESKDKGKQLVFSFIGSKQHFEEAKKNFDVEKEKFNTEYEKLFQAGLVGVKEKYFQDADTSDTSVIVTRVQKSTVLFDADKLEKRLGKKLSRTVIRKRYEVSDIEGLVRYMKQLGAEPDIFKSFISVERSVNTAELDRLNDIGELTLEEIKGCYEVKPQNPYFIVKSGKGHDDEQDQKG